MKRIFGFLCGLLLFGLVCLVGMPSVLATPFDQAGLPVVTIAAQLNPTDLTACPEFDQKLDLNNANIVAFTDCQGFYPTLARLIIQNSPYDKVEDVLDIPELSDRQKDLLKAQLKNFTVSEPTVSLEMRMPPRPMMR